MGSDVKTRGALDLSALRPAAAPASALSVADLRPAVADSSQFSIVDFAKQLAEELGSAQQAEAKAKSAGAAMALDALRTAPSTIPAEISAGVESAKQGYMQTAQAALERGKGFLNPLTEALVARQDPGLAKTLRGKDIAGEAAAAIRERMAASAKRQKDVTPEDRNLISRTVGGMVAATVSLPKYAALVPSGPYGLVAGMAALGGLDASTDPSTGEATDLGTAARGAFAGGLSGAVLGKAISLDSILKKMAFGGGGGAAITFKETLDPQEAIVGGALNAMLAAQPVLMERFAQLGRKGKEKFIRSLYKNMIKAEVERHIRENPDKAIDTTEKVGRAEAANPDLAPDAGDGSISGAAAKATEDGAVIPASVTEGLPTSGNASRVVTPFGSHGVVYAAVEAESLRPSHSPQSFAPNPGYPEGVNPRDYRTSKSGQAKVVQIAEHPDTTILHGDAATPVDGPPIVTPDGIVIGGNGRTMGIQRAYGSAGEPAKTLRDGAIQDSEKFGLDPVVVSEMSEPVIVRVLSDPPKDHSGLNVLADELNVSLTESGNAAGSGVARGELAETLGKKKPRKGKPAREAPAVGETLEARALLPATAAEEAPAGRYNPPAIDESPNPPPHQPRGEKETIYTPAEILKRFSERIGHPFYTKHMGSHSRVVLGFHRRSSGETRTRKPNDIETVAHEVAHLLVTTDPRLKGLVNRDGPVRQELFDFVYAGAEGNSEEGFAEYMRAWLTQPHILEGKAPRTAEMLGEWMKRNPELAKALKDTQAEMSRYFRLSPAERAMTLIGQKTGVRGLHPRRNLSYWIYQRLFDWGAAAERQEYRLHGKLLSGEDSPTKFLAIVRRAIFITSESLKEGFPVLRDDGAFEFAGASRDTALLPLLAPYMKSGELEQFLAYLMGRRAQVMAARGKENLFSPRQIEGLLELGKDRPEWHQDADRFQKIEHGYLDFGVRAGVLSPEAAARMKKYFHVAMFRDVERSYTGGARAKTMKPVKAAHGGTDAIKDPLENTIVNMSNIVSLSLKNLWKQKLVAMADAPMGSDLLARIPPDAKKQAILTAEAKKAWEELTSYDLQDEATRKIADEMWADLPDVLSVWTYGHAPTGDDVMAMMVDGKPQYYQVGDPELMRTISVLDGGLPGGGLLSKMRVFQQYMVTRDVAFLSRAIYRDQLEAFAMARGGFSPVLDAISGTAAIIRDSPDYRILKANGLGIGGLLSGTDARRQLGRMLNRDTRGNFLSLANRKHMKALVDDVAEGIEMATRVGAGLRAMRAGEHPLEAAWQGTDISTDFTMRGDAQILQPLFNNVLFMKAGLAGLYHTRRALTDPEFRGRVWRRVGMLTLLSAVNQLHNNGNPLYEEQSDPIKQTYTTSLIPTSYYVKLMLGDKEFVSSAELGRRYREGGEKEQREAYEELSRRYHIVTAAKPWEIGSIMTLGETGAKVYGGRIGGGDAAAEATEAIIRNFHLGIVPVGLDTALESLQNRSSFSNLPITPESYRNQLPESEWWTARNPLVTRDVGEFTGLPPTEIDHWLNGTLHAGWRWGSRWADWLIYGDAVVPTPNPLRAAWVKRPEDVGQATREFYDAYEDADRVFNAFKMKAKEDGSSLSEWAGRDLQELLLTDEALDAPRAILYGQKHAEEIMQRAQQARARKAIESLRRVRSRVAKMRTLADVQHVAAELAESLQHPEFLANVRKGETWNHIGALKAAVAAEIKQAQNRTAIRALRGPEGQAIDRVAQ